MKTTTSLLLSAATRIVSLRVLIVFIALMAMSISALAVQTKAGPFTLDVTTDPPVIPVGKANLVIRVTDSSGKPVSGLEVRAIASMPGMNMGEKEQGARAGEEPGVYIVPAIFSMGGLYEATITVNGQAGKVELRTGQNTVGGGGFPWSTALIVVVVGGLAVYTLYRIRKTGQTVDTKSIVNRQVISSLLVLGAATAIVVWAVNNLRRPGAMTPIESQAMEMNTPAPEGTLAVVLATAEQKPFVQSVTYSGQVVGFVEQNVVPRVTGTIVSMSVYVGDKVKKGQVLARLDTSQIDPEIAMRSAQIDRAQQGVGVAALEYQMALNEVQQARAEVGMARSELAEAEAMLRATEEGRTNAEAEIQAAEADVSAMSAELAGAEADRKYMQAEYERMVELFGKGAVSKDELQRSRAESDKAAAMVRQASENVRRARAMLASAKSMQRKVEAEISAAGKKVQQAKAALRAKEAMVRTAQSAAAAAKARIGQERAMVQESAAGLKGAATQRSYAQLIAETDGVVMERLISPGQVVTAGQSVMRIAQVSPIRVQANVPEAELTRIKVGANVTVATRDGGNEPIQLRVTSIAPSVDPNVRTGVVEAVAMNEDGALRPGQYISMHIEIGDAEDGVVIPSSALRTTSSTTKGVLATVSKSIVWIAEPAMNGEFEVRSQEVDVLGRSGTEVSVKGVQAGEQVILSPPDGIREGFRVTSGEALVADSNPEVKVTERGYEPASISIPAGKPVKITFTRTVDPSCGDTVVFPELKIEQKLPLNKPVVIEIPAQKPGELKFACPMDMYIGKVVVQ